MREHRSSILVAALSSAFGVSLLLIAGVLSDIITADAVTGSSGSTVPLLLALVATVFTVIAVYVGAIVTSNTFATIVAGRTRTIALYRLIGSSARAQRRAVAKEGLAVGIIGSLLGGVIGTLAVVAITVGAVAADVIPALDFRYADPVTALPIVAVVLTTWAASWVGSRRVLVVSPMQATGAAVEVSHEQVVSRRGRNAVAIVLFVLGMLLLGVGIVVGLRNPGGVLIGMVGGVLSFSGIVFGAHLVMPPALRLVGRVLGTSAPARLAAQNAVRYPERSARTTIGLVIGVTLVTMFAVATETYMAILYEAQRQNPELYNGIDTVMIVTVVIFSVLMGFSALIAAVGMVNNLSLSVLQRTRELGLLRALGFTARQVRQLIVSEAAQLTIAAVVVGLALGTFYGWAGAQSLLGATLREPALIMPAIPLALFVVIVVASVALTFAAAIAPSRRATAVAPVAALAVE
jgi:putative ABC transport system permease protein